MYSALTPWLKTTELIMKREMLIQLWMGKLMDLLILILWKILRDKGMNLV